MSYEASPGATPSAIFEIGKEEGTLAQLTRGDRALRRDCTPERRAPRRARQPARRRRRRARASSTEIGERIGALRDGAEDAARCSAQRAPLAGPAATSRASSRAWSTRTRGSSAPRSPAPARSPSYLVACRPSSRRRPARRWSITHTPGPDAHRRRGHPDRRSRHRRQRPRRACASFRDSLSEPERVAHSRSDPSPAIDALPRKTHAAQRRRDLPDHQEADPELRQGRAGHARPAPCSAIGDGIARVYGLEGVHGRRARRVPGRPHAAWCSTSRQDNVGVALFGDATRHQGRRHRQAHRPHRRRAGRRGASSAASSTRSASRSTARARSRRQQRRRVEVKAPGIIAAPAGERAAADRHQGHRRDDPDRPRPARADHRRPPDRQDRRRDRHDHQPEGQGRLTASTSPSGRSSRPSRRSSTSSTQHGAMEYTTIVVADRDRVGAAPVPRAVHRRHDGRVLPRHRPPRALHLRRPLEAGRRVPPAVAAPAPPAGPRGVPGRRLLPPLPPARARRQDGRALYVVHEGHRGPGRRPRASGASTARCTSASDGASTRPRSRSRRSRRGRARGRRRIRTRAARSPRCRSSRPRPATCRRTSRPT